MAFTCGFYNSVNHDRKYDAVQHGMVFDGIITDGIYATYLKAMVVKASSNPSEVIVQPGRAWFNHTWSYNDADYPVAAPEPEVVLDRIDTLVLDVNSEDAVRDNQFLWVQGTPTSQVPEPPELIHTATHNQYPLCDVYRQAGTTQIYAADITNRVGTSDCPFVTGVLEGINIDDLLAQWDDEFHTWENATKTSFEGWMLNQQAVYSAWWDSLKTQMAGDVADVEEWVQTIKDIIDEETATHLQLEIDEINSMLPSGSHITVTTTDTELYSRAVTITDEDGNTLTSQFDATGVAVFKSVPYVGNLTIEATDGIRTATAVVDTPYFARYEFPLAFWSATVNITGDTELGGETVTITDSSQILVGTVVLNASGTGVFNATYPDTYKFSVTHGGQTMEVSLAVTQETTYNVTIHAGFNWRGWVDTAKFLDSSDYNSLDEVLADEEAVRELCLEHACVDYLAAVPSVNTDIETIINNDLFAKWVNNSDYSLDVLGTNVAIKALMDTADKYGYGEWVITDDTTTPPTWGPKGNVPKMTSNTAPYGEAFGSNVQSANPYYYAFDGNDSTVGATTTGGNIGYKFVNPVCVKRVLIWNNNSDRTYLLEASNDNSTYTPLETISMGNAEKKTVDIDNDNYYLYYRIRCANDSVGLKTLQFYGRELSVSVPTMTGNTTPYGEVIHSPVYNTYYAWHPFANTKGNTTFTENNSFYSVTGDKRYVGYIFDNRIRVKRIEVKIAHGAGNISKTYSFKLQYTINKTTWMDIPNSERTVTTNNTSYSSLQIIDCDEEAVGIRILSFDEDAQLSLVVGYLQFYGLDYSEKEFEEGSTKKWLYDHGVELETLTEYGTGTATKENDDIILDATAIVKNSGVYKVMDITSYNMLFGILESISDYYKSGDPSAIAVRCISSDGATTIATSSKANLNPPTKLGLDVSSINQSCRVASYAYSQKAYLKELWLE